MCGLCGFIGDKRAYKSNRDFLDDALVVGTLRGMDSTGMAAIQLNLKDELIVQHHKRALWGPDFIQLKQTNKILWGAELYNVAMIHHRAGTTGDINDENAHPYYIDHIVGAHNGTLSGAGGLEEYTIKDRTDSWNIFNNMAHLDELSTLKGLYGAYVLTWVNLKEKTFNIARNDMRPLACLWEKKEEQMYWASEPAMLRWITDRNDIITEDKMWEPAELTWYKFPIDSPRKYEKIKYSKWEYKAYSYDKEEKKKHTTSQVLEDFNIKLQDKLLVKPKSWVPNKKRPQRGHIVCLYQAKDGKQATILLFDQPLTAWETWHKHPYLECEVIGSRIEENELRLVGKFVRIAPITLKQIIEVEALSPPVTDIVYGPNMALISRAKWFELTAKGCTDCGDKLDIIDHKLIYWNQSNPMCEKCHQDAWMLEGQSK